MSLLRSQFLRLSVFFLVSLYTFYTNAASPALVTSSLDVAYFCQIHVSVQNPPTEIKTKADVLFFIGFGDRSDNHDPLFKLMSDSGYRVISFDYPSHGETSCGNLNLHDFTSLSSLAEKVEIATREDETRPLYLSGWSTGGLLALRMAQRGYLSQRTLAGLVLIAPGLVVYKIPGEAGWVLESTLTSNPNPPHHGPPSPSSPLWYPLFGGALMFNAMLARNQDLPQIPTLIFLGGDTADVYANTPAIKDWLKVVGPNNPQWTAIQCDNGKHELDNEIEPMGNEVRKAFVEFLSTHQLSSPAEGSICKIL
jgi:alpha-beta hydrolase superfamily lysophospholipase